MPPIVLPVEPLIDLDADCIGHCESATDVGSDHVAGTIVSVPCAEKNNPILGVARDDVCAAS